ncbi:MAG: DUF6504 family protein [Spirochaetia bacterium]|jgi:hypothetical protein
MIRFVPVQVQSYSGYRSDEAPRSFIWNNRRYEIVEIIDRWYQANRDPAVPTSDYFKVRTSDSLQYIIRLDRQSSEWYLMKTGSP